MSGGTILGGIIGFMLGGPIGAVIGGVIGSAVDESENNETLNTKNIFCPNCTSSIIIKGIGNWKCPNCKCTFYYDGINAKLKQKNTFENINFDKNDKVNFSSALQAHAIFFVSLFSMLAKLAKADGIVSNEEIKIIDDFIKNDLKLSSKLRENAIEIFNTAKSSTHSFEDFAKQFYEIFQNNHEILIIVFEILVKVAYADKTLHSNEEKIILNAKKIFNISDYEYQSILSKYKVNSKANSYENNKSLKECYQILGCTPEDSNEKIKESYKKLVKDYHPDVIIAKGLPQDFVEFATQRFKQIQNAYEVIKKARNID